MDMQGQRPGRAPCRTSPGKRSPNPERRPFEAPDPQVSSSLQAADTIPIAHNPRAGSTSRVAHVQALATRLAADGWQPILVEELSELSDRAAELEAEGRLRAVVSAGGDGTLTAVVNRTPIGTPLVVYPLGTENLVARYFGYKRQPQSVADILQTGERLLIDAGQAGSQLFVLMISAGFDAEVVRRVAEGRVGNIRRWTYAKPLWATMRTYKYPELRLKWNCPVAVSGVSGSDETSGVARWVFGMNLSKYAFGLNFAPAASGMDGLLDVCTFSEGSVFHGFRYTWGVFLRRHLKFPDTRMIRCSEMRIEGPGGVKVPYQLDGDFGGFLPVDVRVLPGRLCFLVPTGVARRLAAASLLDAKGHSCQTIPPISGPMRAATATHCW